MSSKNARCDNAPAAARARPRLALPDHQQRKDLDLATHLKAVLVEQLVVFEEAD